MDGRRGTNILLGNNIHSEVQSWLGKHMWKETYHAGGRYTEMVPRCNKPCANHVGRAGDIRKSYLYRVTLG